MQIQFMKFLKNDIVFMCICSRFAYIETKMIYIKLLELEKLPEKFLVKN